MNEEKEVSLEGATQALGSDRCNVTQSKTDSSTDPGSNLYQPVARETSNECTRDCQAPMSSTHFDETSPRAIESSEISDIYHQAGVGEIQKQDEDMTPKTFLGDNEYSDTNENSLMQQDILDTGEVTENPSDCLSSHQSNPLSDNLRDVANAMSCDHPSMVLSELSDQSTNLVNPVTSSRPHTLSVNVAPGEPDDELSIDGLSSADETEDDDSVDYGGFTLNRVESDDSASADHNNPVDLQKAARSAEEEADTSVSRRLKRAQRKRLHDLLLDSPSSSSSSSSSDEDAETANNTSREVDSDTKSDPLDSKPDSLDERLPGDSWNSLRDVYGREIGFSRNRKNTCHSSFTRCVGGSVLLASRLMLYDKHEVHAGCVNALHFNETGSLIASGSDDLKVVVFDWIKKRTFIHFDSGHRSNVFQVKFLPHSGDCHLVTCARDGQIRLAQLSATGSCNRTKKLASHRQAAHKLALLNDSPHVFYSCGEDSVVFQIDLRQEQPNKCYVTKENDRAIPLYSIHCNPSNSNEHCVGGRDQYIRIYDVRMLQGTDDKKPLIKKFCPHHLLTSDYKAHTTCAVYNYNGTEIIGSYNDDDIYLFDTAHSDGAQHVHKYYGHRNNATVKGVSFYGPKSELIVSGSDCGNVFIWHKESEKIVNYFHADDGGVVNVLEPHPHMPLLATSGLDNDIKLWLPIGSTAFSLANLRKVVNKNLKERESERNEPDVLDSQMLWFLMHTLRRNAARRVAEAVEGGILFSGVPDESEDSDSDDDPAENVDQSQCSTS